MDLPTCPACGQSVLDDDAVDCPFCGAPMKGGAKKSGTARPAAKGTIKSLPAVKMASPGETPPAGAGNPKPGVASAAGRSASSPAVKPSPASADEDPFAVDQSHLAEAIAVAPRKSSGRTLEVVCPMCETHGFVPVSAQGKHARCGNPQCLVPVFTVPVPVAIAPPPPPKPKKPLGRWLAYALGFAAVAGAGYYWWTVQQEAKIVSLPPLGGVMIRKGAATDVNFPLDGSKTTITAPLEKTSQEWQQGALNRIIALARERDNHRKATCRRLSATSAVYLNQFDQAQLELEQLRIVGPLVPYEAVPPLTLLAWKHWQAGRKAEFQQAVEAAVLAAQKLPARGRNAAQSAIGLAALLALSGRSAEAHTWLAGHTGSEADHVAAAVELAHQDRTFTVDKTYPGQATGNWERPAAVAVTLILVNAGEAAAAWAWAASAPEATARTECILELALLQLNRSLQTSEVNQVQQPGVMVESLPPLGKACYFARAALLQKSRGKDDLSASLMQSAQSFLNATAAPPAAARLASVKEFLSYQAPAHGADLLSAARAATEIAIVAGKLGDRTTAGSALGLALRLLRGAAPSVTAVQEIQHSILGTGDVVLARQRLRNALELDSDDEARRRLNLFKQQGQELEALAARRFQQQQRLLIAAARGGLAALVAGELQQHALAADPNEREQYIAVGLPQWLLQQPGHPAEITAALQKLAAQGTGETRFEPLVLATVEQRIAAGEVTSAAVELNKILKEENWTHLFALQMASRCASRFSLEKAHEYLVALNNESLREEGLRLVVSQVVVAHSPERADKIAQSESDRPALAAAALTGLVEGLSARPPAASLPAPALPKSGNKPPAGNKSAAGGSTGAKTRPSKE